MTAYTQGSFGIDENKAVQTRVQGIDSGQQRFCDFNWRQCLVRVQLQKLVGRGEMQFLGR